MTNNGRKPTNWHHDGTLADSNIYYCESCDRCWQVKYVTSANGINYYEDFPRYKRERKTCKGCK